MTNLFHDLMTGLDELAAFLAGERLGYKVTSPGDTAAPHTLAWHQPPQKDRLTR